MANECNWKVSVSTNLVTQYSLSFLLLIIAVDSKLVGNVINKVNRYILPVLSLQIL